MQTVRTPVMLVLSPLWFLLAFAVLTAATPLVVKLHSVYPLAVVALVDLFRLRLGGPDGLGWINVAAGWLVPYTVGAAWARGRLVDRTTLWVLLIGGSVATAALMRWAGYPASMVGVPGDGFSNLDPPNLAAVTFGLAQCGAAGLLLDPLRRLMRRPKAWAAVALVNLSAMTIFVWHQTAMIAVTALGLFAGPLLLGLHTVPDGVAWMLARFGWLPLFAVALVVCCVPFGTYERARPANGPATRRGLREVKVTITEGT